MWSGPRTYTPLPLPPVHPRPGPRESSLYQTPTFPEPPTPGTGRPVPVVTPLTENRVDPATSLPRPPGTETGPDLLLFEKVDRPSGPVVTHYSVPSRLQCVRGQVHVTRSCASGKGIRTSTQGGRRTVSPGWEGREPRSSSEVVGTPHRSGYDEFDVVFSFVCDESSHNVELAILSMKTTS